MVCKPILEFSLSLGQAEQKRILQGSKTLGQKAIRISKFAEFISFRAFGHHVDFWAPLVVSVDALVGIQGCLDQIYVELWRLGWLEEVSYFIKIFAFVEKKKSDYWETLLTQILNHNDEKPEKRQAYQF